MKAVGIRWKFARWAAGLVGFVLLLFAAGTFINLYHEQIEAVDLSLAAERRHLEGLGDDAVMEKSLDELLRFEPWLAVAVFHAQGHIVRLSPALPEALVRAALAEPQVHTAHAAHGAKWRMVSFRHGNSTIVLAHALTEVRDIVADLLLAYALSLPVAVIAAALGGWWIAGRALAPLRDLTAAAESIRAEHLDRRVPAGGASDEIHRLADVLNAMLARLEQSFYQTRRFAADASHELRTPLTIMNGEIERLLRSPNLDATQEEKLLSVQEEIGRLDRITEQLLLLARFDSGNLTLAREWIDLSAMVSAACEDAELLAEPRQVTLSAAIEPHLAVTGDPAHLRRAVLSLLDNATRYNQARGEVKCVLAQRDDAVEFRVRNTGPGIPTAMRVHLFERFFRVDAARGRGGHGLGLSLSREIVAAHGGRLELNPAAESGWTEFVITLPLT